MRASPFRSALPAFALVAAAACGDTPTQPPAAVGASGAASPATLHPQLSEWLAEQLGNLGPRRGTNPPILVGAGDIAECYHGNPPPPFQEGMAAESPADSTARLLDQIPGTVIAVGDNAYQFGSPFDYAACYHPTWGRHFERTRPAAGNHEYMTPGAAGYFTYYRERAVPPPEFRGRRTNVPGNGYYSYDVDRWHVVVLNSTPQVYACYPPELSELEREVSEQPWWQALWGDPQLDAEPTSPTLGRLCAGDVAQQAWLVDDLTRHRGARCTLVYFHHPRFSSGQHGNHYQMQRIWDILYAYGVDVAVTGHDHDYERFAPQNYDGVEDRRFGIRQFVVGTGGAGTRDVSRREPNSEVVVEHKHGVIALGLSAGRYDWAFVGVDGAILDSGAGECHGRPPGPRVLGL